MTKKGPLGKAEVFYIKSFHAEKTPQEISKDLDRAISSVNKEIEKIKAEEPSKPMTAGQHLARREGIVMMTENASAVSDENRTGPSNPNQNFISRIKKDG